MENTRRSFLKTSGVAGIGAAVARGSVRFLARMVMPTAGSGILRISTGALRASWPQVARITLQIARQKVSMGIAGSAAAAAAALRAFQITTGKPWYDPAFRPSLRSLITGQVR